MQMKDAQTAIVFCPKKSEILPLFCKKTVTQGLCCSKVAIHTKLGQTEDTVYPQPLKTKVKQTKHARIGAKKPR